MMSFGLSTRVLLCGLLVACTRAHAPPEPPPQAAETRGIQLAEDLSVVPLVDGVWRHITVKDVEGFGRVSSNGLVIRLDEGVVLIDTPWTPAATRKLLKWMNEELNTEVGDIVISHSHADSLGGISEIRDLTRVHALPLTIERATADGNPLRASPLHVDDVLAMTGGIVTFFPGAGHAPDNIVVYLPSHRVLFGGCFVKSQGAGDLGNLADADTRAWGPSLDNVKQRFPPDSVDWVVPGHGRPGGVELLDHTAELVWAHEQAD